MKKGVKILMFSLVYKRCKPDPCWRTRMCCCLIHETLSVCDLNALRNAPGDWLEVRIIGGWLATRHMPTYSPRLGDLIMNLLCITNST